MKHFLPQIQVKKKKGLHQKWNTFFPNSSGLLRSDAHQSQTIGGDEDVHHTQTIGGNSQIIGGDISHYVVWGIYWWGDIFD